MEPPPVLHQPKKSGMNRVKGVTLSMVQFSRTMWHHLDRVIDTKTDSADTNSGFLAEGAFNF